MSALLEVSGLVKRFGGHHAVDGATFAIAEGSITGLIGPNGAGKTTCFNCVAGSLDADDGRVSFAGEEITRLPPHAIFRRGLTRTFQIPQELGGMSVLENLMLVPMGQTGESVWESWLRPGRVAAQEQELVERAHETLALVHLDGQAEQYARNLSGGQRKLLELARVLMSEPKMILVDEPSAGVNPTLTLRLLELVRSLRDSRAHHLPRHRTRHGPHRAPLRDARRDDQRPRPDRGRPSERARGSPRAGRLPREPVPVSALLEAEGVSAGYGSVTIVSDVSLALDRGELATIIGPNGAGKSTLLKAIFGLLPITAGVVRLTGAEVTHASPSRMVGLGVSFVPQTDNVFPVPHHPRESGDGRVPAARGPR